MKAVKLLLLCVALIALSAPGFAAITVSQTLSDIDCFGTNMAPCSGSLPFISTNPSDPMPFDRNTPALPTTYNHNLVIPGTIVGASLTIRTWDLGTCCGVDKISLNGNEIFSRVDGVYNTIEDIAINVGSFVQSGINTVKLDFSSGEVYAVDFSTLTISYEEASAVPEPSAYVLTGAGLAALGYFRRKRAA